MSTYDPAAQPVLSPRQFRAQPSLSYGHQFGGVSAVQNSSTPTADQTVNTLATVDQATRKGAM